MPGPVPKRSDQRRNRVTSDEGLTKLEVANPTYDAPAPNPEWHWIAKDWYQSLIDSGQAHYYQPSDWATAVILAESLSHEFKRADDPETRKGISPMMMQAFFSEAGNLLTTEGQRRRLRLELIHAEKKSDMDAEKISVMANYQKMVGGSR